MWRELLMSQSGLFVCVFVLCVTQVVNTSCCLFARKKQGKNVVFFCLIVTISDMLLLQAKLQADVAEGQ